MISTSGHGVRNSRDFDSIAASASSVGGSVGNGSVGCEEILQLLNQIMIEFQSAAVSLVDVCLTPAFTKVWELRQSLEGQRELLLQNKRLRGKLHLLFVPHYW